MGKGKQVTIYIPGDLYEELSILDDEKAKGKGKKIISKICQAALREAIEEAKSSIKYRKEGITDGKQMASSLSEEDKKYIARLLDKDGPYREWTEFDKVEELFDYFDKIKKFQSNKFLPKLSQIMSGKLLLHDWVKVNNSQTQEDRLGEMAWHYNAGCFEGVHEEYIKNKKRKK
jgi:hypothetical protein